MSDTHAVEGTRVDDMTDEQSGAADVVDSVAGPAVEEVESPVAGAPASEDAGGVPDRQDSVAGVDDSDSEDEDEDEDGTDGPTRGRRRGTESLRRLEEEGEVAADYLEELLDIVDLDGDIDIDVENGRASVAIVAEPASERELRKLVGPGGEVLEALQDLSRLAVQARTGERSRLMLDVAGFRAARRRALEEQAARACQEVQRTSQPLRLEPMTAFERKVVHDVVADAGLVSESEGEDPSRRVVIFPASA